MIHAILLFLVPAAAFPQNSPTHCDDSTTTQPAPCLPKQPAVDGVLAAIDAALAARNQLLNAEDKEGELLRRAVSGTYEDRENWFRGYMAAIHAEGVAERAFNHAITATQDAYGIQVNRDGDKIPSGGFKNHPANWIPTAWVRAGTVYSVNRADGSHYFLKALEYGEPSTIRENGDVYLNVQQFKDAARTRDPRDLALEIQFEAARFDALAHGDWKNPRAVQTAALQAELSAARSMGMDEDTIRQLNAEWHAVVNSYDTPHKLVSFSSAQDSALNSKVWRGEIESQRQKLLTRLNRERADRRGENMHDAPNNQQDTGRGDPPDADTGKWMKQWASKACNTPLWAAGQTSTDMAEWRRRFQALPRDAVVDFTIFPDVRYTCEAMVENQVRVFRNRYEDSPDDDWVKTLVTSHAPPPDEMQKVILAFLANELCSSPSSVSTPEMQQRLKSLNWATESSPNPIPPTMSLPQCQQLVFYRLWYLANSTDIAYRLQDVIDTVRGQTAGSAAPLPPAVPQNPPTPPPPTPTQPTYPDPIDRGRPYTPPSSEPCFGGGYNCGPISH